MIETWFVGKLRFRHGSHLWMWWQEFRGRGQRVYAWDGEKWVIAIRDAIEQEAQP